MVERTVSVSELHSWLTGAGPEEARRLLIGSAFDDGESPEAALITGLDWASGGDSMALLLDNGQRVLFPGGQPVIEKGGTRVPVRDGVVLDERPDAPFVTAVEALRTPADLADMAERRVLLQEGISPEKLGGPDARRAVVHFIRDLDAERRPSHDVYHPAYLALRASADSFQARAGARLFRRLFVLHDRKGAVPPDDCHWKIAALLRDAGEVREAIAASEILHTGRMASEKDRTALAITRFGALHHLWQVTQDIELLRKARLSLKIAGTGEDTKRMWFALAAAEKKAGIGRH